MVDVDNLQCDHLETFQFALPIICFITFAVMAALYRRLWLGFGGVSLALFIAYSQTCISNWLYFIIPACICLVLVIPFLLIDIKESKQDSLRAKINYKIHVVMEGSWNEENELDRLEKMSTVQWFTSYLKEKYKRFRSQ